MVRHKGTRMNVIFFVTFLVLGTLVKVPPGTVIQQAIPQQIQEQQNRIQEQQLQIQRQLLQTQQLLQPVALGVPVSQIDLPTHHSQSEPEVTISQSTKPPAKKIKR